MTIIENYTIPSFTSETTLICSNDVGGTGTDHSTSKKGSFFSYALDTKDTIFQQKNLTDTSCGMSQTFAIS